MNKPVMNKPGLNRAVIFGAGNIGRSFIGNVFHVNDLEVTFIDANAELIRNISLKKEYRIIVKRNGKPDEELTVNNIKAIHSSETDRIISALMECDLCATSVGQGVLPKVLPVIAQSLKKRAGTNKNPMDIIIAENIRNGADYFRKLLKDNGLTGTEAGLIETSIGKMVPIMTGEDLSEDPLVLHAEEYNTLILDKKGFRNKVPDFPEIKAVENIAAWVDRKLFIHNLGHAAAAYFGYEKYPDRKLIAEVLENSDIRHNVRQAMRVSAAALLREYPADFTEKDLTDHIDDLLFRFQNLALGDTVFRVGRDLLRKLGQDDRILGAVSLCIKHGLPYEKIIEVFFAALKFGALGPDGLRLKGDLDFLNEISNMGIEKVLINLCGLNQDKDRELIKSISRL